MSHEIDQLEFQEYLSLRVIADFHVENNRLDATDFFFLSVNSKLIPRVII